MSVFENTLNLLRIERVGDCENTFIGQSTDALGNGRVFGGQVLGQAMMASALTVSDEYRQIHSMHAYFLRPGDTEASIRFEVEKLRDGRSFSSRRVIAIQHDRPIFTMNASFQIEEQGGYEHQAHMPNVPAPESLITQAELYRAVVDKMPERIARRWSAEQAIDMRPVEQVNSDLPYCEPRRHIWFKANGDVPDDSLLQTALLSYCSDFYLLMTALVPHGLSAFSPDIQVASLDHALWFHRSVNMNDWLLYCIDTPNAGNARGFCRGQIFNRSGQLVASVAQEGLMRHIQHKE